MNKSGHTLAGLCISPLTINALSDVGAGASLISLVGCLSGSGAPDYLELNFIKHRTITHILSVWLAMATYGYSLAHGLIDAPCDALSEYEWIIGAFLCGYGAGGISHWIGDLPNKQPIPVITPFDRVCLGWFSSGEYQKTTSATILMASLVVIEGWSGGVSALYAA
jgi:hypothetical protein